MYHYTIVQDSVGNAFTVQFIGDTENPIAHGGFASVAEARAAYAFLPWTTPDPGEDGLLVAHIPEKGSVTA